MSAAAKIRLTLGEYFARERVASFKSEFFQGEMYPVGYGMPQVISDESVLLARHNCIKENLLLAIGCQLPSRHHLASGLPLKIERTGFVAYPDLLIVCGQIELVAEDTDTLNNPVAIVEVLSPSTEKYDRGFKLRQYQQIESLREYILIAQDEPVCERFTRQPDGSWNLVSFVGLEATLVFSSVEAAIPLADIYRGVTVQSVEI